MAAIDSQVTDFLFKAVDDIRTGLPIVAAVSELAFPGEAPVIEAVKDGLTKLFELLAKLQAAPAIDLGPVHARLRDETLAAWRAPRG